VTNISKVENYYQVFDEWGRLDTPSGRLEFELTMDIILKNYTKGNEILDLGGGPGRYTIELAKLGYNVHLADLSEGLLNEARDRVSKMKLKNVKSINKANAVDLRAYKNESFDGVLLLGPLYHLTTNEEREACVKEVYRVLKPNGIIIASFIPYLSGAIGVVDRSFRNPNQVNQDNLFKVFKSGIFNNKATSGFQEGYYPRINEITRLFNSFGFKIKLVRSIRGFAYNREEAIYKLKDTNKSMYDTLMKLIDETAIEESIIDTCGHALYIGEKL